MGTTVSVGDHDRVSERTEWRRALLTDASLRAALNAETYQMDSCIGKLLGERRPAENMSMLGVYTIFTRTSCRPERQINGMSSDATTDRIAGWRVARRDSKWTNCCHWEADWRAVFPRIRMRFSPFLFSGSRPVRSVCRICSSFSGDHSFFEASVVSQRHKKFPMKAPETSTLFGPSGQWPVHRRANALVDISFRFTR